MVTDSSSEDSASAALEMTQSLIADLKQKHLQMSERFGELGAANTNIDADSLLLRDENIIVVRNKADLLINDVDNNSNNDGNSISSSNVDKISRSLQSVGCGITLSSPVSCITGQGIQELENTVSKAVLAILSPADECKESRTATSTTTTATTATTTDSSIISLNNKATNQKSNAENVFLTRARHRRHVEQCIDHLDAFLSMRLPMDAAAEELRLAMMELGKVTGVVDVEEILDVIFRDFCIGK